MFNKIFKWLKHLAAVALSAAIAAAWTAIGNPTGQTATIADIDAFILAVGAHLGPAAEAIAVFGEGPLNNALRSAATALGTSATESAVADYVLKHLGLD